MEQIYRGYFYAGGPNDPGWTIRDPNRTIIGHALTIGEAWAFIDQWITDNP